MYNAPTGITMRYCRRYVTRLIARGSSGLQPTVVQTDHSRLKNRPNYHNFTSSFTVSQKFDALLKRNSRRKVILDKNLKVSLKLKPGHLYKITLRRLLRRDCAVSLTTHFKRLWNSHDVIHIKKYNKYSIKHIDYNDSI